MTSVSIVVPTFNESKNVRILYDSLDQVLSGHSWELIVVDDNSPDGTADEVRALSDRHRNVRCVQRVQERGLCSAVHWGVQAAHGDFIVVMDGDLQHDEAVIPRMIAELQTGKDIVAGSRFLEGQRVDGLSSDFRRGLSSVGNRLVNLFLGLQLTDPLTGFFATRRSLFLRSLPKMQAEGFKVLFDLLYYNRKAQIAEVPFQFKTRQHGQSKLQPYILWLLMSDLASKVTLGLLPPKLISFVGVGLIGSIVHFSMLYTVLAFEARFWVAQTVATVTAMIFNFSINNVLTYSNERLHSAAFYKGMVLYSFIASFGIAANVSSAQFTYEHLKGHAFIASSVGIIIDVIWRFVVSNRLIWGQSSLLKPGRS